MDLPLKTTVENLQSDVARLKSAFHSADAALAEVNRRYKEEGFSVHMSAELGVALWADLKFAGDWEKFKHFAIQEIESRRRPDSKGINDPWFWPGPDRDDPIPERDRILDRIDIALRHVSKELGLELPCEGLSRPSSQSSRSRLERTASFVAALSDVFLPQSSQPPAAGRLNATMPK